MTVALMQRRLAVLLWLAIGCLCLGCSPPGSEGFSTVSSAGPPVVKKHLTAAIYSSPPGLHQELITPPLGGGPGRLPGVAELWQLVHAGTAYSDDADVLRPQLASTIPTIENGGWKVFPDGQ